jgi:hypothetical protein
METEVDNNTKEGISAEQEWVSLNVGGAIDFITILLTKKGTILATTRATLTKDKDSMLYRMFSSK